MPLFSSSEKGSLAVKELNIPSVNGECSGERGRKVSKKPIAGIGPTTKGHISFARRDKTCSLSSKLLACLWAVVLRVCVGVTGCHGRAHNGNDSRNIIVVWARSGHVAQLRRSQYYSTVALYSVPGSPAILRVHISS